MKNLLWIVCALAISSPAFAQQQGGLQGAQTQSGSGSPAQAGQGQNRQEKLQEIKQRMMDRIDQRINTLQDAKSCVEQAQDFQALKACRPQRNEDNQKPE